MQPTGQTHLLNQYYPLGQINFSGGTGTNYFYTLDHTGSIREMTNSGGSVRVQYAYDSYGRVTKLQGSLDADFQYAGYYVHSRSGLNLTKYRAYSPTRGGWLSRDALANGGSSDVNSMLLIDEPPDPQNAALLAIQNTSGLLQAGPTIMTQNMPRLPSVSSITAHTMVGEMAVGPNLYAYVNNDPIRQNDPIGLICCPSNSGGDDDPCGCHAAYDQCSEGCRKLKDPVSRARCWAQCAEDLANCIRDCNRNNSCP